RGYENVSVDEIIAATNTSKGTFYHYFRGKEEIISEISRGQRAVIDEWSKRSPTQVQSLEGHINRLLLDLASNLASSPRLVRSMMGLSMHNDALFAHQQEA